MLLCEVALGQMNEIKQAEYMEQAPAGFNSTKGRPSEHATHHSVTQLQ